MTEEGIIQKAVFDNLKARGAPGVVYWHCPNGPESRRKSGFRAGVSDVHALHCGEFFVLELKAKDGTPSHEQIKYVKDVQAAKGNAAFAYGLDDALATLEAWGLLRKAA